MYEQDLTDIKKLSIPKIIILGLSPGLVIFLWAGFFAFGINLSMNLSLVLAIILGLIPTELGILKFIARKENKKIRDLILFQNKTPMKYFVFSIIITLIIAGITIFLLSPYEMKLWQILGFVSELENANLQEIDYLKITLVLFFIFNGLLGPIVEEIYFRGYLLPRMGVFGKFAPLINMIIFSIYHFFSPLQNISRIIGFTPMVYAVWINKDIKIGIIVHCLINIIGNVIMFMTLLAV